MSENLSVRPAQLRPAARAEKIEHVAAQVEKSTPALAANGRVVAPERTLKSADKLDARTKVVRAAATAAGRAGSYGDTPEVSGKGRRVDIRVY